ncbi:MAG: tRNA pseudouridine(13) synthase TruD [Sulfurovum sp.]|nr:tRNA pseudouridine(13) synthase TruD [Sulfurovum sp.]MCB4748278.1 tRNA pseudouridine(13) synthase TruD [Sulfurovum sp.]MCB4750539.1 tRNA pseudouridine(13) synthase TruD [Sulfurovum sp.]MCB4751674.1 tRNA pseudouridine(13) synthase TruD [Sulfurovum sp.]MCB4754471.1 tRNA pseudouridine(13) synthase TruD [Sulfurovum sp.]
MNHIKHYAYPHTPIHFNFKQTITRFFVEEIPLYCFTNNGNHLILKIKKTDMSTWKLITVLAKATGLSERDIGYAGLKDKSATTIQYFSIPKQAEKMLNKNLSTERVEVLERILNKAPLKVGHLKGNRFCIILHSINEKDAKCFHVTAKMMQTKGIPNYYGYQRFGEDGKSYLQGKEIAHSGKRLKGSREKLMVAAYQSYLFNKWLQSRVKLSKVIQSEKLNIASKKLKYPLPLVEVLAKQTQFFKLFLGDILMPYPYGKPVCIKEMRESAKQFEKKKISPTGLLCGANALRAQNDAYHLEGFFDDDELTSLKGDRRFAWIWPKEVETEYNKEKKQLTVNFYLPKGAYATTFLEEIGKFSLKE